MKTIYRIKSTLETTFSKVFSLFEDEETIMNTLINELGERLTKVELERRRVQRLLNEREKFKKDSLIRSENLVKLIKENKEKDQAKALELLKAKKELDEKQKKLESDLASLSQTLSSMNNNHEKLNQALFELRRKKGDLIARQMSLGIIQECGNVDLCFDELDKIEARLITREKLFNSYELPEATEMKLSGHLTESELIDELKSY